MRFIDAVVIDLDNNRDKVRAIMDVTKQVKSEEISLYSQRVVILIIKMSFRNFRLAAFLQLTD